MICSVNQFTGLYMNGNFPEKFPIAAFTNETTKKRWCKQLHLYHFRDQIFRLQLMLQTMAIVDQCNLTAAKHKNVDDYLLHTKVIGAGTSFLH